MYIYNYIYLVLSHLPLPVSYHQFRLPSLKLTAAKIAWKMDDLGWLIFQGRLLLVLGSINLKRSKVLTNITSFNISNISDENLSNDTTSESILQIYSLQSLVEVAQGSDLQLNLGLLFFLQSTNEWRLVDLIVGEFVNMSLDIPNIYTVFIYISWEGVLKVYF